MKPGRKCLREYEYIRHGTLSLIAAKDVTNGKVIGQRIKPTRNEQDFLEFIQTTVGIDPDKSWWFIVDQLNTHMSESLVRWVAKQIGYRGELGKKGQSGILKNMATRKQFLEDESHRIRFLYTPKHCSWLNQIEIWFNQLGLQVITHGNFPSRQNLESKITAYIDYYNRCLARPCNWKYTGDKLCYVFSA